MKEEFEILKNNENRIEMIGKETRKEPQTLDEAKEILKNKIIEKETIQAFKSQHQFKEKIIEELEKIIKKEREKNSKSEKEDRQIKKQLNEKISLLQVKIKELAQNSYENTLLQENYRILTKVDKYLEINNKEH